VNLQKRVLAWTLSLLLVLCLSPATSAQTKTPVLDGKPALYKPLIWHVDYPFHLALLPNDTGSPSPQRFNTASCQSFSMYFAWDPTYGGPVHVSLIYEGSLVVLYSNTFYGGYGSFTVNYFPYSGFVHIFVSNLDDLYYLDIEGTTSLWYQ